jgi:predicted aminopeptidase
VYGRKIKAIYKTVGIISASIILVGCSAGFIVESAYEQSKILLNRKPIDKVVADQDTPAELRQKLVLVQKARSYAESIGLNPGGSFKSYSKIDRDTLVWVVAGSKKTAFALHTWWFPIVGTVPYKGFFHKNDALAEASRLQKKGYETSVRGADALSTLGWFDDPVLTTMLRNADVEIVNTVIHESVHSTVWIPNHVPFNESLANFVGIEATTDFYKSIGDSTGLATARAMHKLEDSLSLMISTLYDELNALYESNLSEEEKLKNREAIFNTHVKKFKVFFPTFNALSAINNAEIMQLKFYLTNLKSFDALYRKCGGWEPFFKVIREIANKTGKDSNSDPFKLLEIEISKD